MTCSGFPAEQYELFALGTLEVEEAAPIARHVNEQCDTCIGEVRRSMEFWGLFGTTFSEQTGTPLSAPQLSPRRRVMAIDDRASAGAPVRGRQPKLSWYQWGAIAATLAIATATGAWYFARFAPALSTDRSASNQVGTKNSASNRSTETASLQRRVDELTRSLGEITRDRDAARVAARTGPAAGDSLRTLAARDVELRGLRQTLAGLQTEVAQGQQELTVERNRASRLEADLASRQERLNAALRDQAQAQTQLTQLTDAQKLADERVRALTVQVRQLTQERTQLLQAVETREKQSAQGLRMISLLSTPGTRLIPIADTEAAPKATAYALLTADKHLLFSASGLPSLPSGRDYQLWIIRASSPAIVSGGVFRPAPGEVAQVEVPSTAVTSNIRAIAVTDEPAGGSIQPTGHKLLTGLAHS